MRFSLDESDTLARAFLLMQKLERDGLPVLTEDKLVGVLPLKSITRLLHKNNGEYSQLSSQSKSVKAHMVSPASYIETSADLLSLTEQLILNQAVVLIESGVFRKAITREDLLCLFLQLIRELRSASPKEAHNLVERLCRLSALDFIRQSYVE